ncbi:MAG: LarC family nickel insertion protein [Ancalomicrobiaceae bacterium]|nr:LarC family nickel insertion protein [Ancalomicrobiaceae bacterium]
MLPGDDARHIHLDAVGGVAGDMFVAALLDALPSLRPRVFADLAAVLPAACGEPELTVGTSGGIAVNRFGLGAAPIGTGPHGDAHAPRHSHEHGEAHAHSSPGTPDAPVRVERFVDMAARISAADVHPGTAEAAIAILSRLAEAESRIHAVPLEAVHFHELADWDSLMDVVAAGSIVAALTGATWSVSDLPLGRGLVRTAHGLLPVPAPATAEMLQRFHWRDDGIGGERVTPTGAAILAHLIDPDMPLRTGGRLTAIGTGAGTRTLAGLPNILRATVFAAATPTGDTGSDEVIVIAFDVDDMTGEEIGDAAGRLRAADGVIDVTLGARQGKKGRPVTDFRLLVRPDAFAHVRDRCFVETSTLGFRWRLEQRICLARAAEAVEIDGRTVTLKRATRPGGDTVKVENDSLAAIDGLRARRRARRKAEATSGEGES